MARSRRPSSKKEPEQHPDLEEEEIDNDGDVEVQSEQDESESEPEKDEAELELERAVFGDNAGFRQHLQDAGIIEAEREEEPQDGGVTGLEGLDDAQVG